MYSQPLNTIAAPPPGESDDGFLAAEKKINLELRIGSGARSSEGGLKGIVQGKGVPFFTDAQFHELCSQIFIYNSIAYGFPVAFHLLMPIWMSVFNSLGPAICYTYPSFSGVSPEKSDHSSVMDSEPGRCRRTDGRKWRCSRNVVPLQKYCERHMHRGRQGSRKHVEPIAKVPTSDHRRMPVMSSLASTDMDVRASVTVRSDLGSGFPEILKCRDNETRDALFLTQNSIVARNGSNRSTSSNVVGSNYAGFASPRFGLSPKSVLVAAGKVGHGSGCTTVEEDEPQRCRRTDGKKWQCRRGTVPNQKYCEAHMHRGAKRLGVKPGYSRSFLATPAWTAHKPGTIPRNLDSGINLNTVPASPQHAASKDSSSSTSDATTISDDNVSFCLGKLSPQ